jgi:exodeoxyribonuclease VII small subunit
MVKKSESYEEMMSKLEEIVEKMENGDLSLEQSIKNYEDGMKLCNRLYKLLNEAEGKIKVLSEKGEADFEQGEV